MLPFQEVERTGIRQAGVVPNLECLLTTGIEAAGAVAASRESPRLCGMVS